MTADWKVEPDDATFEQQVVEQSFKTPVLVDFWAAWCAPCRMLGPILEKVVEARAGKVILAKVDTEAAPKAAGSFRVQSIPAVYLLDRGEVVDGFQGMIPESQLANWLDERLDRLSLLRVADLEVADPAAARAAYEAWLEQHPLDPTAVLGLIRLDQEAGDLESAKARLAQLEDRGFLEPEAEQAKARLQLAAYASQDIDALDRQAGNEPDNLAVQLQWAQARCARGEYALAMDRCLKIIESNLPSEEGQAAKSLMLETFQVWSDEQAVNQYRQNLSLLLF